MSSFMLSPIVVAVGIIGFLIATQAVNPSAVIGAVAVVLYGVAAQLRKKSQP